MTYARLLALLSLLALFSSTIAIKITRTPHQRGLDARNVPPIPEKIFGTNSGRDAKNKRCCCCCCNNCCFNPCCCSCNLCCWLAPSDQFYSSRSTTFNHDNISTRSTSVPMISWNGDRNSPAKNTHVYSHSPPSTRSPTSFGASEGTVLPHPTRPPPIDPPPIGPPPIDPQPVRSSHIDHPSFYPHPTRHPPIDPQPIHPPPTYPPVDPQPIRPPPTYPPIDPQPIRPPPTYPPIDPQPIRPPPTYPPIDHQPIRPPPTYPPIDPQPIRPPPTYPPIDHQPIRPPPTYPPIDPQPIDPPPTYPPIDLPPVHPPTYTIPSEDPTSFPSSSLLRGDIFTEQRTNYERNDHFDRNCNSRELREILVQCIAYNPSESKQRINAAIARKLDGSFGILCADGAVSYLARTVSYLAHTTQFCHLTRNNITCLVFRESEL